MLVDRGGDRRAALCLSSVLVVLFAGCGQSESPKPAPAQEAGKPETPAAASEGTRRSGRGGASALETTSEPYESAELGALAGTILFRGDVPERFPLGAASASECKHHPEVDQRANLVVVNDGKLAGVFVTLASGQDGRAIPPAPEAPVTLDQRGCMFVPRVVALRAGQKLQILNSDPTTHNVNLKAKRNRASNRSMGAGQTALEFVFEKREAPIAVGCDIHPWMGGAVFVEEHPWFAISDEHGAFRIPDVPPGEYTVQAVHELLPAAAGRVQVVPGKTTVFTLTLER